jgi:gluconokinase
LQNGLDVASRGRGLFASQAGAPRRVLAGFEGQVELVYLRASHEVLKERLRARTGHFAGVSLLDSQLALLDEPIDALVLDATQTPE